MFESLEERCLLDSTPPNIVVGRTLATYFVGGVQNNQETITYTVYNEQADPLTGNGSYTASDTLPTTGTVVGTYTWSVKYAGDANNNPATDQGGTAEQTVVSKASPTIMTTASGEIPRCVYTLTARIVTMQPNRNTRNLPTLSAALPIIGPNTIVQMPVKK